MLPTSQESANSPQRPHWSESSQHSSVWSPAESRPSIRPRPNGTTPTGISSSRAGSVAITSTPAYSVRSSLPSLSQHSQALSLSTGRSSAAPPSQLSFQRPAELDQPVVASRLAKAVSTLAPGDRKHTVGTDPLAAIRDIKPAAQWWSAKASELGIRQQMPLPATLASETIGILTAQWPDPPAMTAQRRYATCRTVFGLDRVSRAAAACDLLVDGDIVGSELYAFQHACHLLRLDCDELDSHLRNREDQLKEVIYPPLNSSPQHMLQNI